MEYVFEEELKPIVSHIINKLNSPFVAYWSDKKDPINSIYFPYKGKIVRLGATTWFLMGRRHQYSLGYEYMSKNGAGMGTGCNVKDRIYPGDMGVDNIMKLSEEWYPPFIHTSKIETYRDIDHCFQEQFKLHEYKYYITKEDLGTMFIKEVEFDTFGRSDILSAKL